MDRYFLDPLDVYRNDGYALHDRRLGHSTRIAVIRDDEMAQRICALLNADEAWKAAAAGFDPEQALIWRTGK